MQPPLKDAAGYRSRYINALNAAATANEIVAGDLDIHRTPQGTTLRLPPRPRLRRFRLVIGDLNGQTAAVLAQGNLILADGPATLLAGKDVAWSDVSSPNPGWCTTANIPSSPNAWLDAILAQHTPTGDVYVVFQPGAGDEPTTPLHQLLPAALGTLAETDVAPIVTIGRIQIPEATSSSPSPGLAVTQHIADDIPALAVSSPSDFRHRWQVTATREVEPDGSASWTVNIRPGSVWTAAEDGAVADAALTPVAPVAPDAENGGWKVEGATSGSLYVALDDAGAHLLKYGDPAAETAAVILRIADVAFTTGDPPSAVITQRQVGDERIDSGGSASAPVAWTVAKRSKETSSGTAEQWQIFAPTWTVGRETLLPEGMEEDWNDLDVSSGDLYAVLSWTGTATTGDDGEVKTTWTPGKPTITNDLSAIPADEDPTPDDPSTSTIEGKEGHRSIIVKIGTFLTDDTAGGDSEEPDPIAFLQIHAGSIIEDLNSDAPAPAAAEESDYPFKVTVDDNGTIHIKQGYVWEQFPDDGGGYFQKKVGIPYEVSPIVKEDGGWKIENPSSGVLYLSQDLNWAYTIYFAKSYEWKNTCTIAEIEVSSSGTKVTQCQAGDIIVDGSYPLPWCVCPNQNDDLGRWRVEKPFWVVGRTQFRNGPNTLSLKEGDSLYAYRTWRGTKTTDPDGNVTEKWVTESIDGSCTTDLSSIPEDAPADRYGGGRRTIIVLIGYLKEGHFNQCHIGAIIADISSSTSSSSPEPAEVDTLGPIEWDASRNAYVQYIGKWTYSGSAWVFAKKMNGNTAYPPAAIYPVTAANILVRANQYGSPDASGSNIAVIPFNLPFASATATNWLTKQESTVSKGVVYTPPETVDGSGSLDSKTFTITYWSDTGETNAQTANLLDTIVETANQTTTYSE